MAQDLEEALRRVRGEIYGWSPSVQRVVREHGWRFTPGQYADQRRQEDIWEWVCEFFRRESIDEARREGRPWYAELERLTPEIAAIARELPRPVEIRSPEEAGQFFCDVADPVLRRPPARQRPPRERPPRRFEPRRPEGLLWVDEPAQELSNVALEALLAALAQLVRGFLDELADLRRPPETRPPTPPVPVEVRFPTRPDPGTGPPIGLPPGFEAAEEGSTTTLVAQVGAGATATVVSPTQVGPAVVERISMFSDAGFDGRVQLNVQAPGVAYAAGAAAAEIFGGPLILSASNFGGAGAVMNWTAFNRFLEWWPRRVVRSSPFLYVLTVTNLAGATRNFAASVDRREIRGIRPAAAAVGVREAVGLAGGRGAALAPGAGGTDARRGVRGDT